MNSFPNDAQLDSFDVQHWTWSMFSSSFTSCWTQWSSLGLLLFVALACKEEWRITFNERHYHNMPLAHLGGVLAVYGLNCHMS